MKKDPPDEGFAFNRFQGDIAEILIINRALTLAELNLYGAYVTSRYGLTWSTAT